MEAPPGTDRPDIAPCPGKFDNIRVAKREKRSRRAAKSTPLVLLLQFHPKLKQRANSSGSQYNGLIAARRVAGERLRAALLAKRQSRPVLPPTSASSYS